MIEQRVAVLVDGDNVGADHADSILAEAGKLGRIDIARVYAAAHSTSDWLKTPGFRLIHAGQGKNASDLLLCIDAMELALASGLATFAVATSDGDFTHLAQRLRERGAHVLGLGEQKAPQTFRAACTNFSLLSRKPKPSAVIAFAPAPCSDLDLKIRKVVAAHGSDGRSIGISLMGVRMHKDHGATTDTLPGRSWRNYLKQYPKLYDIDPPGPAAMVRLRPTDTP